MNLFKSMNLFKLTILAALMAVTTAMKAQGFLGQLETEAEGQGTITVDQDSRLTDILNGMVVIPSSASTHHTAATLTTESKVKQESTEMGGRSAGVHTKARGYRIQVFFGTNQRSDQTKAQQTGTRVTRQFPELRAYTSFESPHWRCRVGDFIRREDANQYMRKLRSKGFTEAMVVQSEIFVSADQIQNR